VIAVPLAEATTRPGSCWARFLAQCWSDPDASRAVRRSFEAGPYRAARRRIARRLDQLPAALRERRLDHAVGLIVMSLAATELALAHGGDGAVPTDAAVADLVDVVTAVLAAPSSDATLARLDESAERIA
jgi:hypothetical protein